jgi:hypothetical protein
VTKSSWPNDIRPYGRHTLTLVRAKYATVGHPEPTTYGPSTDRDSLQISWADLCHLLSPGGWRASATRGISGRRAPASGRFAAACLPVEQMKIGPESRFRLVKTANVLDFYDSRARLARSVRVSKHHPWAGRCCPCGEVSTCICWCAHRRHGFCCPGAMPCRSLPSSASRVTAPLACATIHLV